MVRFSGASGLSGTTTQEVYCSSHVVVTFIDVKNIDLQIKKHKNTCFFHLYKKTLKTCIKTLNYSIHSSKKHRQYESNKVNNTATKHSLCPGNGVFAHEKCIIHVCVILYAFVLTTTKT